MVAPSMFDRVKESCRAPGTGAVTLLGAPTGFQAFGDVLANGESVYYCIADRHGPKWEVGVAVYNSGPNTLTRSAPNVLAGAAGPGTLLDFDSGVQDVFCTLAASVPLDRNENLADLDDAAEARDNLGLGTAALADSTDFDAAGGAAAVAADLATHEAASDPHPQYLTAAEGAAAYDALGAAAAAQAASQPLDADLTAIAALTTATFGRSLLTESSATTARATLGGVVTGSGSAAVGGFDPSQISWEARFRADDLAGADGTAVSSWSPVSGNADAAVQATGSRQPVIKAGANGINGHKVVRFDGSNDYLATTVGGSNLKTNFYWAGVIRRKGTSNPQSWASWGDASPNGSRRSVWAENTSFGLIGQGADLTFVTTLSVDTAYFVEVWTDQTAGVIQTTFRINGVIVYRDAQSLSTYTGTALILGEKPGLGEPFNGDLAEVFWFNGHPTAEILAGMPAYAASQYGLASGTSGTPVLGPGSGGGSVAAVDVYFGPQGLVIPDGYGIAANVAGQQPVGSDVNTRATTWTHLSTHAFYGPIWANSGRNDNHVFKSDQANNVITIWNTWGVCAERYLSNSGWESFAAGFTGPDPASGGIAFAEASDFKSGQTLPGQYEIWQTANGSNPHVRMSYRRDTQALEWYDYTRLTSNGPSASGPSVGLVRQTGKPVTNVANDGTLNTQITTGAATCVGVVSVYDKSNGKVWRFFLRNATLTAATADNDTGATTTQGNAGTLNVYASGGQVVIENKTGGALNLTHSYDG